MDGKWTLTVRDGPRVGHKRFESLPETVDAMERELDELIPTAKRRAVQVPGKRFDAARQVAVRAEVAGPGGWLGAARGGVDMRGDGSIEAYTGRLRRRLVELQAGETPYDGLRRALREGLRDG
jgi:hypothetical protein